MLHSGCISLQWARLGLIEILIDPLSANEAQARRDYYAALALLERYSERPLFSMAAGSVTGDGR